MNNQNSKITNKLSLAGASLCFCLMACNSFAQTTAWWDNNGASAATSGTWDTNTADWALGSALTGSTVAFTNGNYPIFAAGTAGILNMTITVPGVVSCSGLGDATTSTGAASGAAITNLTFSGAGSINLPTGAWPFECGNSSPAPTLIINVPITGPGGIVQHNAGALELLGTNTYSGGTTVTGGQILWYNNNASFGTGPFTNTGASSIEIAAGVSGIITLTNAFALNTASVLNFASGNTTCTGPFTLGATTALKNNGASTTVLTLSGPISGAFGINFQAPNSGKFILSGPNTFTGATSLGTTTGSGLQAVTVTSINSVTTPAQQTSSSLGKPSSVANGTIALGSVAVPGGLIYTGSGETSDRVINLAGTTGGATIEMDGTGPLVLTSAFTATGVGAKTLTLQGTSTATNTISGAIVNSSSGATALTKAQAGAWVLTGTSTFTGATTISGGTLTIGGAGRLNSGSYAGAIANSGSFIYSSTASQTLSGVVSGAGTLTQSNGTVVLSGANTYTGTTTIAGGTLQANHSETVGTSGSFGKSADVNPGNIVLSGGTLQYSTANNNHDFSGRFSTAANQAYNIDLNSRNVTYANAGLTSSGGQLTLSDSSGSGTLTLNAAATYTGTTTINSGTLSIGSSGSLGSGNYAASITDKGAFIYGGASAQVLSGAFTGTGSLTQNGAGSLTLSNSSYTGATTIGAASSLFLAGSSSFASISSLTMGAGALLDVSALGLPTLNVNTASLAATGSSSAAATVNGAPGGVVNLGSQPLSLTISPTTFNGATQPALVINQSLQLNGNVITVNNTSGTPLGAGNYTLIQVGSGITGTPNQFVTVTGNGLVTDAYATVQVIGGNVVLVVTQPSNSNPTWNGNDFATLPNWSDAANWASGAPDLTGDSVFFANSSGSQSPVMDSSYSVLSLTFASGCSSDILTASGGSTLTVGSGVTNASGNPQTIATPLQLVDLGGPSVPSVWSVGAGITVTSPVSDAGSGLMASGPGTLTLSGANTYTGGTFITNGATLSVNTIADTGTSAIGPSGSLIFGGGTLSYTGAGAATTARTVTANGPVNSTIDVPAGSLELDLVKNGAGTTVPIFTKTSAGTLILGGTLDNSGLTMAINTGEVIIAKATTATVHGLGSGLTTIGTGTGGNSAELQLAGSGGFDLFNTCAITVNTDGFLDLNGQTNNFGTLTLSGSGPSGNGAVINSASSTPSAITNTSVVLAGNTTFGGPGNIRLASVVSGSGMAVTYAGTGTLTFGGANTYNGGTTVNSGGTFQVTAGGTASSSAGPGTIALLGNGILTVNMGATEFPNTVTGGSSSVINLAMAVAGNLWLTNTPSSAFSGFSGTFNVTAAATNGGQLVVGTAALAETINAAATWQIQPGAVVDFNVSQTDPATVQLFGLPTSNATLGALRLDGSVQSGPVILMGNSSIGNGNAIVSTISGPISDVAPGFGFTKAGGNSIVLTGTNTYGGATTINGGSLGLSGTASISNTASITIAAGATLDVSQLTATTFSLSSSNVLNAIGTSTNAATIIGATTVDFGSRPINLTFKPTVFTGDTAHASLLVSQGALALNGNVITVNNAAATPLGAGTYTVINVAGGTISGTVPTAVVTGSGLAAGSTASFVVSGGSLNLVVTPPSTPPSITGVSAVNGSLVISGTGGVPNGTFYLITSTNLTAPIVSTTNWTVIATNTFSPTGTFSVTNAIGTNASSFFSIVEVP